MADEIKLEGGDEERKMPLVLIVFENGKHVVGRPCLIGNGGGASEVQYVELCEMVAYPTQQGMCVTGTPLGCWMPQHHTVGLRREIFVLQVDSEYAVAYHDLMAPKPAETVDLPSSSFRKPREV